VFIQLLQRRCWVKSDRHPPPCRPGLLTKIWLGTEFVYVRLRRFEALNFLTTDELYTARGIREIRLVGEQE